MDASKKKTLLRIRRKKRVRKKIDGTPGRPRLSVFRSCKHIYAQLIDDVSQRTLVSASSVSKDSGNGLRHGGGASAAKAVGKVLGERAVAKGIKEVRFDRSGYKYHGRVKALAEAAREAGLKF